MKGSAKKCGIVGDMLVSVAAVMGTVHLVLRFASWIFFFFFTNANVSEVHGNVCHLCNGRFVIGGFVVGTISAQLHATGMICYCDFP